MVRTLIFFTLIATFLSVTAKADAIDEVSNLIRAGNAKELSGYLAAEVELSVLSPESILQKAQAEAILQDFFTKHRPSSIKIIHKLTSNPNLLYAEMILNTASGVFRTSV